MILTRGRVTSRRPLTILVASSRPKFKLAQVPPHHIEYLADGEVAADWALRNDYDLAIVGLDAGPMTGKELARTLKLEHPRPVILLAEATDDVARIRQYTRANEIIYREQAGEKISGIIRALYASGSLSPEVEDSATGLSVPLESLTEGVVVNGYTLVQVLGKGGTSIVWEAVPAHDIGTSVAIKFLLPRWTMDLRIMESFWHESKVLSIADHPAIPKIIAADYYNEFPYMVLPFINGRPLADISGRLSPKVAVKFAGYVARKVFSGLAHVHGLSDFSGQSLEVLHRNICPQNILLTSQGEVYLVDYASSKSRLYSPAYDVRRHKHSTMGHIPYIAPEVFFDGQGYSSQTDIYGAALSIAAIFQNGVPIDEDRRPLALPAWVPSRIQEEFFERALDPDPGSRFATAGEALEQIQKVFPNLPESEFTQNPVLSAMKRR